MGEHGHADRLLHPRDHAPDPRRPPKQLRNTQDSSGPRCCPPDAPRHKVMNLVINSREELDYLSATYRAAVMD